MRILAVLLCTVTCALAQIQPLAPRQLEQVFDFARLESPVLLTHAADGSGRVFLVEKAGLIKVLRPARSAQSTFFDHRASINSGPNEAGLLGLAFHPDYASNGRVFVCFTHGNLVSRISEFRVSGDPDVLDPASERVLLDIDQPAGNHNGGMIAFGPDGMLYAGFGDGGASNDRFRNGQDPTTLLGTILRLDVDRRDGDAYGVPPDNPFVGNEQGWRSEIWAWGLRNPWRFSFDRHTGDLWVGDVGQNRQEEIDLVVRGGNYGWNLQEGFECFGSSTCDDSDLLPPVLQYGRADGISVTGGYVYRGRRLGQLHGAYVYADFGSRHLWAIRHDGTAVTDSAWLATAPSNVSSFGENEQGELYVVGYDGRIYQFAALPGEGPVVTAVQDESATAPQSASLRQNYPNPFNPGTMLTFALPTEAAVDLVVYDILGRTVRTLVGGSLPAGTHRVYWNGQDDAGRNAAAGVYLYRLQVTRATTLTRSMVLAR